MKRLKLSNRLNYTILGVIAIILLGVGVYAYNSGGPASTFGHSADELDGVCKSDGADCINDPFYGADSRFTINAQNELCFDTDSTGSCTLQSTVCDVYKFITISVSDTVCGNSAQRELACDIQCASTVVCEGDTTPFSCGTSSVAYGTFSGSGGCGDGSLSLDCYCSAEGASYQREVGLNQRCI